MIVLKLEYEGEVRLVEVGEPASLDKIKGKFLELFGDEDLELKYTIPGDADMILIATDDELLLAQRFGGKPLKIMGFTKKKTSFLPSEDELSVFEEASLSLKKNGVDDAPAKEIEQFLNLLQLQPRRLVKYGLAPPHSLKFKMDDGVNKIIIGHTEDDDDSDSESEAGSSQKEKWEQVPVSQVEDLDINDDKDTIVVDAECVPEGEEEDVVVKALKGPGCCVTMSPSTIHALLRILDVQPRRFVRLGLVSDLATARAAYKTGGKGAADAFFKSGGKGNKFKGWGRGLCGGRGRGRGHGWSHEQQEPDMKRQKNFGHHNHFHGPHPFGGPPGDYNFGHHNTFHATPPSVSTSFFQGHHHDHHHDRHHRDHAREHAREHARGHRGEHPHGPPPPPHPRRPFGFF